MFGSNLFIELSIFNLAVFGIVLFDSGILSRKINGKINTVNLKSALLKVLFYFLIAVFFAFYIYQKRGANDFFKFSTAYFLEISLSIDNVFVFILIFNYFKASNTVRNRVLLYGVIAAFFLRGIFIFLGIVVVQKFSFALLIFGLILVVTAIKILYMALKNKSEDESKIEDSKILKIISKIVPIVKNYEGSQFVISDKTLLKYNNLIGEIKDHNQTQSVTKRFTKPHFTKAFLILVFVSLADIIFAVDSIPAVFAVSQDIYIIYTSNILAILGLRSLFFVIDRFVNLFEYLKHGLGIILLAIGLKLCAEVIFPQIVHNYIPVWSMLAFSVFVFAISISISKFTKSNL
jgi:tellurite resistance protein TerC